MKICKIIEIQNQPPLVTLVEFISIILFDLSNGWKVYHNLSFNQ